MKDFWNEYRTSIWLAVIAVVVIFALAGCMDRQMAPVPESRNDSDRFAKLHSNLEAAYSALVIATTPSVEGAQPLLSYSRGREILKTLDKLSAAVDTADEIRIAGHGGYENPEALAATLRALRAQIPEPSR